MTTPFLYPDEVERRRRRTPDPRRGIAEALADAIQQGGATSVSELQGLVDLERRVDPAPMASSYPVPRTPSRSNTARDLGVETDFVSLRRGASRSWDSPLDPNTLRHISVKPDVTRASAPIPKPEEPEEISYRDPMGVAQTRGQLERIAAGSVTINPETKRPYTEAEREEARRASQNIRARVDREEAKGGFGRRMASAFGLGTANAPLQREINEARRAGHLVTQEDIEALGVTTREGQRLRTEPTFFEGLREEVPSMVGELPWYLIGPGAAEARLLRGAGSLLERRGARSIGEALGRIGRDEISASTIAGRAGQRAARGSVQGGVVGAGLDVTRRAAEGETPSEIAAALPLDVVLGAGTGAILDPIAGAAFDVGRAGVRAAGAGIRRARERNLSLADMEIPTHINDQPPEVRMAIIERSLQEMGPAANADANVRMEAERAKGELVREQAARDWMEDSRFREEQAREVEQTSLRDALERVRAEVVQKQAQPEAVAYREAIAKVAEAEQEYNAHARRLMGPGTTFDMRDHPSYLGVLRAYDALNIARQRYGAQTGVAAITALAANKDDLTEEEKEIVGLGGLALAGSTALVRAGDQGPGRLASRLLGAVDQAGDVTMSAAEWYSNILREAPRSPDQHLQVHRALLAASGQDPDGTLTVGGGQPLSADEVRAVVSKIEDPTAEEGRAPLRSRLIEAVEALRGPAWDKPRPAADWIGKLKQSSTGVTARERAIIMPVLEEAQRQKKKVTRSEVLTLANRLAPEIEQVTLARTPRPSTLSSQRGDAQEIVDFDDIEAEVRGALTAGRVEGGRLGVVQEQIDNRAARIAEIEEEIETRQNEARDSMESAEQEQRRRIDSFVEAAEGAGISRDAADRAIDIVNEEVEAEYVPRGTIGKAMQEVLDELSPDDEKVASLLDDAGYVVEQQPPEFVFYREGADAFGEEGYEVARIGGFRKVDTGRTRQIQGQQVEPVTERAAYDEASALAEFREQHGDIPVRVEVEESDNWIVLDQNGSERGAGNDREAVMREVFIEDGFESDWIDEIGGELRSNLSDYADATAEWRRAESEHYYYTEDESSAFPDEIEEKERLEGEQTALEALLEETRLANQLALPGTGRPTGEAIAIVDPEVRDLDPATNPYLMPLKPVVKGQPLYPGTQSIGGGYDYAEYVNVWVNNPGDMYTGSHHARSGGVQGNDVGHLRAETHNVRPALPEIDAPVLVHKPDEPDAVRHLKDQINLKRRERDGLFAKMTEIVRQHEAMPEAEREGDAAIELAKRYRELNQQAIHLSEREEVLIFDLLRETGASLSEANKTEPVRVMLESQSDWSQQAYERGVRLDDAEQERLREALRPRREATAAEWDNATRMLEEVQDYRDGLFRDAYAALEGPNFLSEFRNQFPDETWPPTPTVIVEGGAPAGFMEWMEREFPGRLEVFDKFKVAQQEYARVGEILSQARAAKAAVDAEWGRINQNQGVPPSPFLEDNAAFTLNAARFLIDSAERGFERIAWSDAANRVKYAHLPLMAAQNVYEKYTPSAIKKLLGTLGFKDVKFEKLYIKGAGHWSMRLTPEMRMAIRRTGLPILGLAMLVGTAEEAQAQEPGAKAKGSDALGRLLAGGAGATIATGALVFLARRRAARLAVQNNPALKAALSKAIQAMPPEELARARRPEFAFQRAEPTGTPYEAPIDVAETPTGKGAAQFNVAKIGLSTEGETIFRDIVERLSIKKRYVSWDETNAEAAQRTTTIDDLLHLKPWTGTDALAARMFMSQSSERLSDLSKRLGTATPEEKAAITAEMDRLSQDIGDIARRAAGEREAAGRTLNAYKIIAKHNMDEGTWQTLAQRAKGEVPLISDEILKVREFVRRRDREALTGFISGLHRSSPIEKWLTFWKAGLLTGLTTHIVNPLSNAMEAATLAVREPVAVAVDAIIALARGTEREKALPRGFIASRVKGFRKGIAEGKQILKTGVRPEEIGRWDVRQTNYDNPILQKYTQFVFRMLAAEDRPFYNMALEASLDELSTIEARRAVRADPSLTFDQVHAAIRANPPNDLAARAADEATRAVFQNKGTLARMASGAQAPLRKGGKGRAAARVAVETTLPFTQTPSNIASRFVDTTPLGLASAVLRQLGGEFDQRRFSEDIARALTGTGGFMLLGYWLAENDMLTGSAPTEPGRRDLWRSQGKQAHSIKLFGRWWNVARLGPSGMTMAMGAQLHAMARENPDDMVKLAAGMTGSVGRVMLDQSFLLGLSRSLEAVADPGRYAGSMASQTAGSVVPAAVGRAAQASDPLRREARTPGERVQSRVPGASRKLRPQLNVFGEPMRRTAGDRVAAVVDPLNSTRAEDQPLLAEIDRLGLSVPPLRKSSELTDPRTGEKFTVRYSDAERHDALRAIGPRRRDAVQRVITSRAYKNMPDREKEKAIRRAIEDADDEFYAREEDRRIRERVGPRRRRTP